jgi:RNA polymerase sigma-70 factor (ECF subfamily)
MDRRRFPHISEEELVEHALAGSLEAFDELVRRFRSAVTFVAEQILGSHAAAEDVVQDTFLLAFKALSQLKEPRQFAGWLCAIARHRARRVAAREGRMQTMEHTLLDQLLLARSEELSPPAMETCLHESELALVRALLAHLPSDYQTVLYLRYFEEWPVRRIAEFLSLSVTTVQWRLHHGRELLRRQLAQHRGEPTDDRPLSREPRNRAARSPSPPDGRHGPRGQHDGEPGEGDPACRRAVQSGASAP